MRLILHSIAVLLVATSFVGALDRKTAARLAVSNYLKDSRELSRKGQVEARLNAKQTSHLLERKQIVMIANNVTRDHLAPTMLGINNLL